MQVSPSALQAERRQLDYTAVAFKCIIKEFNLLNKGSFFLLESIGLTQHTLL